MPLASRRTIVAALEIMDAADVARALGVTLAVLAALMATEG